MTDQARTGTPAYRELRAKHGSKPKRPDFQRIQPRPYQAEKRSTFFTQEKNLRHHYHHYRGGYSGNHYESELPRSSHQESMIASSGRYTDDALKYARFEAPNGHMDYRGMKRARESPAGPPGEPHYKYPKTIDDGQKSTRSYRDYGWNPNNDQSPLDRMRRETYPPRSPYSPFQHEQSPSPKLYTFKSPTILSRRTSPISSANPLFEPMASNPQKPKVSKESHRGFWTMKSLSLQIEAFAVTKQIKWVDQGLGRLKEQEFLRRVRGEPKARNRVGSHIPLSHASSIWKREYPEKPAIAVGPMWMWTIKVGRLKLELMSLGPRVSEVPL
ncbi:hypothetical protein IE53DRAFT_134212 [Violaceomyces palustris]|uniref:Uncharacterized protein n=1 Tax=Violaceomyces palustris TaxID=1673888 RepID=A0ACD0P651_9BASI|nr:hypothetical protein IE53DRAFT_134212 [Violaceomyces palustris]